MKFSNQTIIYINVALLFVFTFRFALKLFSGIKTGEFNYFQLILSLFLIGFTIFQIIKLGKIENNK